MSFEKMRVTELPLLFYLGSYYIEAFTAVANRSFAPRGDQNIVKKIEQFEKLVHTQK